MSVSRSRSLCLLCVCCVAVLLAGPAVARAQAAPRSSTDATVTLFSDDFEGTWGWWPASDPYGWCLTTYRSDGGTHSAHASSGTGASAFMDRGPFDLSGATGATLDFDLWYYAPQYIYGAPYFGASGAFDIGYSLNGSEFTFPIQWAGDTGGWAHQQVDVSWLCGHSQVWIEFGVTNASSMWAGYSEGAYIDNVTLTATFPDTTPPTTIATGWDLNWHNSAVPVTLTATDNAKGSGVKSITYALDGGAPTTVDAASTMVTIAAPADHANDGKHTLSFYATDKAANQETAQSVTVKIDTTSPTTTATGLQASASAPWQKTSPKITLSATDNSGGSGVAHTYFTVDGGTQQTYAVPFYLLYDGAHTVRYWSVDKAGNTESAHSGYVKIDSKAPTAAAKALSVKAAKAKKGKTLKIKVTIADPTPSCGSATLTLTLTTKKGSKLWSLVKTAEPTNKALVISRKLKKALARGTYFIVCRATDAAGNLQATATKAKLKIT